VPDAEAVTLEGTDGAAGEAGVLGDPAAVGDPTGVGDPAGVLAALTATEPADEPQAVTSKAAHVSPAQASPVRENTAAAATCRDLRDFVVNIDSYPLKPLFTFQ
jgi:hypothetical protein